MMLPGTNGSPPRGVAFELAVAAGVVAIATIARLLLDPYLPQLPFITYVVAVAVAGWIGGRTAGLVTVVAGTIAGDYFFLEPRHSLAIATPQGRLTALTFVIVASCLLAVVFAWRRNQAALLRSQRVFTQAGQMAHLGAWAIEIRDPDAPADRSDPLYWSDETYRIFGHEPNSVRPSQDFFFSHVHPDDAPRVGQALTEAIRARKPYAIEHRIVRPDGTERVVYEHAEVEYDRSGRACWIIGAVQDMTDRKRAEDALRASEEAARAYAEELTEANRLKDEFIATVSHELRTPLNAILGWAELLRERRLDADAEVKAVEVIASNARRQAQLIEDLLDMSRIEAGKLRLEATPIEVTGPVAAAIEAVLPSAAAKGVRVRPLAGDGQARVLADASRLQQVVWNLLTNAVKFTPAGGEVFVEIRSLAREVDIVVRDTGAGIRPDFLPHVFDRFRQAEGGTTRRSSGLGIGLSIVRHLVEAHGGRVSALSAGENQGAVFVVTLPLYHGGEERRAPAVADASPLAASGRTSVLDGIRVLAVDDEPDARELAAAILGASGADVQMAGSVDAALDVVCRWTPDVLVVDIAMPSADGFALLRRLRELAGPTSRLPAIALSAYAREEDRQRGLDNGFCDYLTKPVDEDALVRAVLAASRSAGSPPPRGTRDSLLRE